MPWALLVPLDFLKGGKELLIFWWVSGGQAGVTLNVLPLAVHLLLKSHPCHSVVHWRWTFRLPHKTQGFHSSSCADLFKHTTDVSVLKKPLIQLKYCWGKPVIIKDCLLQMKDGVLALHFRSESLSPNWFACWISIPLPPKVWIKLH